MSVTNDICQSVTVGMMHIQYNVNLLESDPGLTHTRELKQTLRIYSTRTVHRKWICGICIGKCIDRVTRMLQYTTYGHVTLHPGISGRHETFLASE